VVVIAFGESKAGAMREAIDRQDSALPVAPALMGSALWLLGESADEWHDRTQPGTHGFRG
jgi:hypothetical protein